MTELPKPGFKRLTVEDWRQFNRVDIDIHPRLTVLTGANASGKSTLLALLGRHFNWSRGYSASPVRVKAGNEWRTVGRRRAKRVLQNMPWDEIGTLTYGSGLQSSIAVPIQEDASTRVQYDLVLPQQQPVTGLFISSHRLTSGNYTHLPHIPTVFDTAETYYEQFDTELRTRWAGGWSGRAPQLAMKETLVAAAVFGSPHSEYVDFNAEAYDIWNGFQKVLRNLMPTTLGFHGLRVRAPDIIVQTATEDFILDEASGGLSAIIEVAWQIFLRSKSSPHFTVVIDEPENHLHPSLQRDFIPNLLRAFPGTQFVVATHSPFVVTAVQDSNVYVLDYNDRRSVDSRRLDYVNKAANADETLRKVLGVTSTYPAWAEARFNKIVERYMTGSMTLDRMQELRHELAEVGLSSEYPEAVIRISDGTEAE
jgi:predicted ATPase